MKLLSVFVVLIFSFQLKALTLNDRTIEPLEKIFEYIELQTFEYVGRAKLFDYVSTQSCYYRSESVVILEHYCYPVRQYPARALTIISPKFGSLYFYQEYAGSLSKRQIEITNFASDVHQYFPVTMSELNLTDLDSARRQIYEAFLPSCWSQYQSSEASSACNNFEIKKIENWIYDSEMVLKEENSWNNLYNRVLKTIPR